MAKKDRRIKYESATEKPVMVSVRLPRELYDRLERYASQHRQSISELLKDGAEMRLEVEADPRSRRVENPADATEFQIDGASILRDMQATLARHETQMHALMQAIERQTTPTGNGAYDSNTTMPATDVAISYQEASYTQSATLTDDATVPLVAEARAETATLHEGNTVIQPAQRQGRGRKPVLRFPILELLQQHPEGLTAAELKVYLQTEKHIGDTLAGMVKAELLVKNGTGQGLRYQLATAEGN